MQVVDAVLEDIRLCMEAARAQLNRRRVAMVKYLGELYNYQLLEAGVIFRTLFSFISFGSNPDGEWVWLVGGARYNIQASTSCDNVTILCERKTAQTGNHSLGIVALS